MGKCNSKPSKEMSRKWNNLSILYSLIAFKFTVQFTSVAHVFTKICCARLGQE